MVNQTPLSPEQSGKLQEQDSLGVKAKCTLNITATFENSFFSTTMTIVENASIFRHQLADLVWSSVCSEKVLLAFDRDQEKSFSIITILRDHVAHVCEQIIEFNWLNTAGPLAFEMRVGDTYIKIDGQISLKLTPQEHLNAIREKSA